MTASKVKIQFPDHLFDEQTSFISPSKGLGASQFCSDAIWCDMFHLPSQHSYVFDDGDELYLAGGVRPFAQDVRMIQKQASEKRTDLFGFLCENRNSMAGEKC